MHADEFAAWLRLLETPGVGRDTARRLLAAFGDPATVLGASAATLRDVVGPGVASALGTPPPEFVERLAAAEAWRNGGVDRHVVTLGDTAYPPALLQTADPPLLLYVHGRPDRLSTRSIAVVGSRSPTPQGRDTARAFARAFAAEGWIVVSGLALGIDGAAHSGALDVGGATVAVIGTGPDRVYPSRHHTLAHRIVTEGGAIVGEFAPGTPPLAENFPQRNRIIAALAHGTVVVEAALRSGSLITARLAAEAGRDVFAVPGSIYAAQSKGCHALIRQGAALVESAADVLEGLGGTVLPAGDEAAASVTSAPADPLLEALGDAPVTLDALLARTGWPTAELSARLLDLELDGALARLPGGLYQRRHGG